ncbi:MAG: hypothetical protein WC959_03485 [Kiritimatiellales bacterium]
MLKRRQCFKGMLAMSVALSLAGKVKVSGTSEQWPLIILPDAPVLCEVILGSVYGADAVDCGE